MARRALSGFGWPRLVGSAMLPRMAILHYGTDEITLTDDEVKRLTRGDDAPLYEPGLHSLNIRGGWIHLVTGPGIPIWIDQRMPSEQGR